MAAIKGLTNLRSLDLILGVHVNNKAGLYLSGLSGLKKLSLGNVSEDGLKGVKGLTGLEQLGLNYSRVDDANLQYLAGLTGLLSLDLSHTAITDAGLKHIGRLANLRKLNISNNDITDKGLAQLAGLTKLQELSASDCKIAGASIKQLTRLAALTELELNGNPVVDANVPLLKDLAKLQQINLTGTQVSDGVALELKKSRPKLSVRAGAGNEVSIDKKEPVGLKIVQEDISKMAPDFSLTAEKYNSDWKENPAEAKLKYENKIIELTGDVNSVVRGSASSGNFINLNAAKEILGVTCYTVDDEPWAKVAEGQTVKLKGKSPVGAGGPALAYSVIVDAGKFKVITISAANLAKEYVANADATAKKYNKKQLIVTGVVLEKKFNSAGSADIKVKGFGNVAINLGFAASEKDLTNEIKVGQTIKVVGEFWRDLAGEIGISRCLPFKKP